MSFKILLGQFTPTSQARKIWLEVPLVKGDLGGSAQCDMPSQIYNRFSKLQSLSLRSPRAPLQKGGSKLEAFLFAQEREEFLRSRALSPTFSVLRGAQ